MFSGYYYVTSRLAAINVTSRLAASDVHSLDHPSLHLVLTPSLQFSHKSHHCLVQIHRFSIENHHSSDCTVCLRKYSQVLAGGLRLLNHIVLGACDCLRSHFLAELLSEHRRMRRVSNAVPKFIIFQWRIISFQ